MSSSLRERIVSTAFLTAFVLDSKRIEYKRGDQSETIRGITIQNEDLSELTSGEVNLDSIRCFVIEAESLDEAFTAPERNDRLNVEEGAISRTYAILSRTAKPIWSYWNNDPRYWKVFAREVERE